jgi:hypothetical protein
MTECVSIQTSFFSAEIDRIGDFYKALLFEMHEQGSSQQKLHHFHLSAGRQAVNILLRSLWESSKLRVRK